MTESTGGAIGTLFTFCLLRDFGFLLCFGISVLQADTFHMGEITAPP